MLRRGCCLLNSQNCRRVGRAGLGLACGVASWPSNAALLPHASAGRLVLFKNSHKAICSNTVEGQVSEEQMSYIWQQRYRRKNELVVAFAVVAITKSSVARTSAHQTFTSRKLCRHCAPLHSNESLDGRVVVYLTVLELL